MRTNIWIPKEEKPGIIKAAEKATTSKGIGAYLVKLHNDSKDRKELINQILTCINDGDTITTAMLEDWGQDEYHINHRPKS